MSKDTVFQRWFWSCAGAGVVGTLLPLVLGWQHVPDPMSTHWGLSGAPDGSMRKVSVATLFAALVLVPVILAAPRSGRVARPSAPKLAVLGFVGMLMTALSASTVWLNWGRSDWQEAGHMRLPVLLSVAVLPLALAGAVLALARRRWPEPQAATNRDDALPLGPGERAHWSGTARNAGMLALGAFALMEGAVLHLALAKTAPGLALALDAAHVIVFLTLELFSKIRVSIDERAITVRYGHLGWLRQRIRVERVFGAEALEIEAMAHGGWGYRGSVRLLGRAAIVVRSGSAVRLDLGADKRLVISVDDAETASRLINGFIFTPPSCARAPD
jgi:hypothetical protein